MGNARKVSREDLDSDIREILRQFEKWFFPASVHDVGNEFIIFLAWLYRNNYAIIKAVAKS